MKTLTARLALATMLTMPICFTAFAQDAKQDMKTAGSDVKGAAKNTGKGVAHAAKTTKTKTKSTVHKASSKVAKKTDSTNK